jgi:6-phosphogluconolactonase
MSAILQRRSFPDGKTLAKAFAQWTAELLRASIDKRGEALLIVSGGTTPKRYFAALALEDVDWSHVTITLADERRVPDDSPRSNARLVRETLLRERAAAARFVRLADTRLAPDVELANANARIAELPFPADLVVLGMGDDGHTASWFPGGDNLEQAIDPNTPALVLPMRAPDAAEPRLTLTARVILGACALALHVEGSEKLKILERALSAGPIEDMPIRAALRGAPDRLTVFSA